MLQSTILISAYYFILILSSWMSHLCQKVCVFLLFYFRAFVHYIIQHDGQLYSYDEYSSDKISISYCLYFISAFLVSSLFFIFVFGSAIGNQRQLLLLTKQPIYYIQYLVIQHKTQIKILIVLLALSQQSPSIADNKNSKILHTRLNPKQMQIHISNPRFASAFSSFFSFLAMLTLWMLPQCCCLYSKSSYIQINQKITGVANCKQYSHTIFTTPTRINLWLPSDQRLLQYEIGLGVEAQEHVLVCSKYGSQMTNAYVGVLDNMGGFTLWEDVSTAFSLYVQKIQFGAQRVGRIHGISVGGRLLAVGYHEGQPEGGAIDVYDVWDLGKIMHSVKGPWLQFKLDHQGNLCVLTEANQVQKVMFQYYLNRDNKFTNKLQSITTINIGTELSIDYQRIQDDQNYIMRFLISSNSTKTDNNSGLIFLTTSQTLTQFSGYPSSGMARLCDGQLTYNIQNYIQKHATGTIIVNQHRIDHYTCTTDTGRIIYSQFYIVSQYTDSSTDIDTDIDIEIGENVIYFIDCFYDGNFILQYLIYGLIICCCFCVRLCANTNCNCFGGCQSIFRVLFELFCWCPASAQINDIQDSLQH